MNKKIEAVLITIIVSFVLLTIIYLSTTYFHLVSGGVNKLYLPFPVKIISCGSSFENYLSCTYPFIWSGIIYSAVFWIIIILAVYKLTKKLIK